MKVSQALNSPLPVELPFDVRAMNAGASVLFAVGAMLLLGLGLTALLRLPIFTLRVVTVDGDVSRNSAATIRANAITQLAGNFFSMNLARSQKAFEAVPWVRSAVVRRVWPNRLKVTLEEHHAAAYWEQIIDHAADKTAAAATGKRHASQRDELETRLVNTAGEVFDANLGDVEDDNLPTLQGPAGQSALMLDMLHRLQSAFDNVQNRIDTLHLSERGSWAVVLDDGAQIELGRGDADEVLARTQRFLSTLAQVTGQYRAPLESADLRYPQGYAVHLRGMSTLPAASHPHQNH